MRDKDLSLTGFFYYAFPGQYQVIFITIFMTNYTVLIYLGYKDINNPPLFSNYKKNMQFIIAPLHPIRGWSPHDL